ncbi:helix-turn-helix domain-containing protein [Trabulsiella guamensis]|nr:helix-turn-helix transcriptional regulator [Trabulsiella guamensis]
MSDTYSKKEAAIEENADCKNDELSKLRFAERLKQAIGDESNLAFAKKCGLSDSLIGRYLRGESYPSIDKLPAIALAAGRSMSWLIGDSDGMANHTENDEELKRWWLIIFDSLSESERQRAIHVFKRHGLLALFADDVIKSDDADSTVHKEILEQRDSNGRVQAASKVSTQKKAG